MKTVELSETEITEILSALSARIVVFTDASREMERAGGDNAAFENVIFACQLAYARVKAVV